MRYEEGTRGRRSNGGEKKKGGEEGHAGRRRRLKSLRYKERGGREMNTTGMHITFSNIIPLLI